MPLRTSNPTPDTPIPPLLPQQPHSNPDTPPPSLSSHHSLPRAAPCPAPPPQTPKVYVQQRLAESGDLVWSLLQAGGHFYVCGDASSMAGAVEEALLAIIGAKLGGEGEGEGAGAGGRAAAEEYLKAMSEAQRYQRDVWY